MINPIKIPFNWIGPRGPIPNSDLPNILNIAAVADGAMCNTNRIWNDNVYWRLFKDREPFCLASVFDIKDQDVFLYPLSLFWRIPFEFYFLPENGIFEFSLTPQSIIDKIKHQNGYILLECGAEAWVRSEQLKVMHDYFIMHNIPLNKIIYLVGCMNAQDVYDDWCTNNNIASSSACRMHMISYPSARYAVASGHMNFPEPLYNTEIIPEKLFLCWNRRFRPHRSILAVALDSLGLVDKSYYSMGLVDPEFNSSFSSSFNINYMNMYNLSQDNLQIFVNKLPLLIDGATEINEMCGDISGNARMFYQNSLLSIVTETNWDLPHLSCTEKSFKPFRDKHPFIIVGVNGALKSLRNLGFKTFSEFWDESYDEVTDCHHRLLKIIQLCNEISKWDNEKILDFKRRVKPIMDHNYQMLKNSSPSDITDQVEDIINSNT